MKIRKIIVALAAVLVPFLVFRVGSGLTEQQNVTLRDYTVSENEKTLTLHALSFRRLRISGIIRTSRRTANIISRFTTPFAVQTR